MSTNKQENDRDAAPLPLTEREQAMRRRLQSLCAAARNRKRPLAHAEKQELAQLLHEISEKRIFARGEVRFASLKDYWRDELGERSTVKLGQLCAYGELLKQFADARKLRAGEKELRPLILSSASAEAKQRSLLLLLGAEAQSGKAVSSAEVAASLEEAERESALDREPLVNPQPTVKPLPENAAPVTAQAEPAKPPKAEEPAVVVIVPEQIAAPVATAAAPSTEVRPAKITPVENSAPSVRTSPTAGASKPQAGGTATVTKKGTKKGVRYVPAHMLKGAPPNRKWYGSPNSNTIRAVDWPDLSRQWPVRFDQRWNGRDLLVILCGWFLFVFFITCDVTATKLRDADLAKPRIIVQEHAPDETAADGELR